MNLQVDDFPNNKTCDGQLRMVTTKLLEVSLQNLDHLSEGLAAARLSAVLDVLKADEGVCLPTSQIAP